MEGQVPTADECRRALFNHTGSLTAKPVGKIGMLAVPYKPNLKSVPYQPTQIPNSASVGNDPVSFRYDLSPCKPYGTTYSRSLQNKLKICAVSPHATPKTCTRRERPRVVPFIYHPANLTERHTVVPYKISLKSVPYQLTQNPKTQKKARGIN